MVVVMGTVRGYVVGFLARFCLAVRVLSCGLFGGVRILVVVMLMLFVNCYGCDFHGRAVTSNVRGTRGQRGRGGGGRSRRLGRHLHSRSGCSNGCRGHRSWVSRPFRGFRVSSGLSFMLVSSSFSSYN